MSSLWTENIEMPEFPTLEKDIRTQVLIIGGGMAGVLCAYFLQQAGVLRYELRQPTAGTRSYRP